MILHTLIYHNISSITLNDMLTLMTHVTMKYLCHQCSFIKINELPQSIVMQTLIITLLEWKHNIVNMISYTHNLVKGRETWKISLYQWLAYNKLGNAEA